MISFLSSPKPWSGIAIQNQYAAVQNWFALHPDTEVILYGDSPGTHEACRDLGISHVPDIGATKHGIPYFGAIAKHAAVHARHDLQCYINCDILLAPGFLEVFQYIAYEKFLVIGQRIDLAEGAIIKPGVSAWRNELLSMVERGQATLHPPAGSDYFVFPRGLWQDLPPVVIGRGGYDNALIAFCLKNRIPVIDATLSITPLHQFHDYGHVKGGVTEVFTGESAKDNLAFMPKDAVPMLEDATYILQNGLLKPNNCRGDQLRYLFLKYRYGGNPYMAAIFRLLWRVQIKLHLSYKRQFSLNEVMNRLL